MSIKKNLSYGNEAREAVLKGVDKVVNAVKVTLGPMGRNVLIENAMPTPISTKDGVTVARNISLKNKEEEIGAQLIKEVASKTEGTAGDGTTTASLLAQYLIHGGLKAIKEGRNPVMLRRGMLRALEKIEEYVCAKSKVATPEQVEMVARIAANEEKIGTVVASLFNKIGKDGVVSVKEASAMGVESEFVKGLQIDKGYLNPYFITDVERGEAKYENANVFLTDYQLMINEDLKPLIDVLHKTQKLRNGTLIIAEDIGGEALMTLMKNKIQGAFPCVVVKAPAWGDRRKEAMQDIALVTGATVVSKESGRTLESIVPEDIGFAETVTSRKMDTVIIGDPSKTKDVEPYIANLEREKGRPELPFYDKDNIAKRIGRLAGGVAVLRIGAATETELKEMQYRVDDAIAAARSALEEGVLAGGGIELLRVKEVLMDSIGGGIAMDDEDAGIRIVCEALTIPFITIAENAGYNSTSALRLVSERNFELGFNAETGITEDLFESGVLDAAKVVRMAIRNAVTVAGLVLITEVLITNEEEEK